MESQKRQLGFGFSRHMTLRKIGIIWIVNHFTNYWILYALTLGPLGVILLLNQWNEGLNFYLWRTYQFP